MTTPERKILHCAIYTRKSTEHNLDLEFNSLDAQREASEAYIKSQAHEGWRLVPDRYDDGGLSGASLDRSALQKLLADVRAGKINTVVVYKVDRLTRSLADFAKLVELFDQQLVSFVSITQSFNTVPANAVPRSRCDRSSHRPLISFENEGFIFPSVHHSFRFCLLTNRSSSRDLDSEFCFFLRRVEQLQEDERTWLSHPPRRRPQNAAAVV